MMYKMKNQNQNQNLTTIFTIDEIFLRAYARQGMSYSPLENDYYERPQSE